MRLFKDLNFRLNMMKHQRLGVFVLMILILCIQVYLYKDLWLPSSNSFSDIPSSILALNNSKNNQPQNIEIKPFNPNLLTQEEWKALGFSDKQIQTIFKYKQAVGGAFTSKEQFAKCYAVQSRYEELEPYIILDKNIKPVFSTYDYTPKRFSGTLKPFNPNSLDEKGWKTLGFSDKQIQTIFKYKKAIGGAFTSKEQFAKCYAVQSRYDELEPYIQLSSSSQVKSSVQTQLDINTATAQDLQNLGINFGLASRTINFRNALGGFYALSQLNEVYGMDEQTKSILLKSLIINKNKIQKINLNQAPADMIGKHIYLRKYKTTILKLRNSKTITLSDLNLSTEEMAKIKPYVE